MKTVKNLSVANIKGTNFVRREDLDFSDDGNRFRGYSYKGLPITTLYSDGCVYCDVRPDYLQYNGIPWEMWKETEEYKLCNKYNGTSELIDLDDLANICEKVLAKLNSMKVELDNMDVSEQKTKVFSVLFKEQNELSVFIAKAENFNWFKLFMDDKLSDCEMKKVRDYLKSIKKYLERVNEMLKQLNDGVMSKKDIVHYGEWASEGHVVLTCRFYLEQITEYMNK